MELTHTFTVPATVDETWAAFNDIESVAGCFPGAQVTSAEGDSFAGTVKVKLGPIALVYNGSGQFVEKDEAAGRMVIDAKGKDKRGNGTAGAHVTATMKAVDAGTEVTVLTDLAITGKPAQFGRGVMQDVSDKLLGIFVECLKTKVGDGAAPVAEAPAETPPAESAPGLAAPAEAAAPQSPEPPGDVTPSAPPRPAATEPAPPRPAAPAAAARNDDALDLGATVLPVLAKAYWKPVVGVLALIVVVVVLVVAL